ncbi:hypothetical protein [Oleiagrimonas sp. C23AA]|uniref:hypothetical protein n=1 Tax=Oleiagrimonas sp. C23AA TaxID=2719047 RepID=UPI0014242151|nr:hypothetical protein [Oleiagrimonas sp. C23AA]NII09593.1 hypothetical protein [Oleiagrimonas sp. C23AA]
MAMWYRFAKSLRPSRVLSGLWLGVLAMALTPLAEATPPKSLDLSLPPDTLPAPASTAPTKSDAKAPGVYYGDHSGIPAQDAQLADSTPDTKTHIHGSVSMGVGYASGFGTGTTQAAHVHIDKTTDSGSRFDVDIGVQKVNGFDDRPWDHHGH